ncbi:MAG TPA: ABC transporter substrate-binding protein [Xanthobacteraceae bacterium]|jgi:putative ABC transport system substrate-binding protein|nr:ABC transporter substrate-binding protein [Xanthobacteraceae bacterium]
MRRREFITLVGSAAITHPFAARAQQATMPVIGYLSGWSPGDAPEYLNYFRQGLAKIGYAEGRNVAIEYRYAAGHLEKVAELAADLVRRQVNVIAIPNTTQSALAAKAATQAIPIIFSLGSNPVEVGLVQSLNHPGGNVTGLTALQTALTAKRLELVHELLPDLTKIAFLVNPANRALAESDTKEAQAAARALGINLINLGASNQAEIDTAFESLVGAQAGALLTNSESLFMVHSTQFATLTARHRLPALYAYRENAVAGGLMSYGADFLGAARELGIYVGRVLKGEKPADLPVQQASKIEFVINMRTAKALGLTVPLSLLSRATEAIE